MIRRKNSATHFLKEIFISYDGYRKTLSRCFAICRLVVQKLVEIDKAVAGVSIKLDRKAVMRNIHAANK